MSADRPICVLIGALGGQGGGVLTDWLVEAAGAAGYPAQSTSIPGVAQRTGATTYYFELYPERNPPSVPVLSLFPDPDDLDLMIALEPTEAGRALSRGLITPRTVVITCTNRVYSTAEKIPATDGRADLGAILEALASRARKVICFTNGQGQAGGGQLNSVMLGAIAGAGVLPLGEADFRRAIEESGVAVKANLAGFEHGLALAGQNQIPAPEEPALIFAPTPPGFTEPVKKLPDVIRQIAGHALARMIDYQDRAYAELYLVRLGRVVEVDRAAEGDAAGYRLSGLVANRLAAWMSYEDVVRVAQLKTRPGRMARMRSEVGAGPDDPIEVVDYLKPSREEFQGMLPAWLAWIVPKTPRIVRGVPMHVHTTSPWGFATLRMLAAMRWVRRMTGRYAHEQKAIEAWLAAIVESAQKDYELACRTAELAIWARGYGKIRTRGLLEIGQLTGNWSERLAHDVAVLRSEIERSLSIARDDPDAACRPT